MSSVDQSQVDQLLSQIEALSATANSAASPGGDIVDGTIVDIPGNTEAPAPPPQPDLGDLGGLSGQIEGALTGEFDAPPTPAAGAASPGGGSPDMQRLMSIEVPVLVLLGQRQMNVGEVMRLAVGAIIEFNKSADEELELLVNNKGIGRGTAVKVGENFGIKITNVGPVRETIRKLGGG